MRGYIIIGLLFFSSVEFNLKDADWSIVEPAAVDSNGDFQSHVVHYEISSSAQYRTRRDADSSTNQITYRLPLSAGEHPVLVVLDADYRLYSSNLVIEERFHDGTEANSSSLSHCHFQGHIQGIPQSKVALSTCNGLVR